MRMKQTYETDLGDFLFLFLFLLPLHVSGDVSGITYLNNAAALQPGIKLDFMACVCRHIFNFAFIFI